MTPLKRIWHFLWEEDSIWSWIVNIVLAFILIKFVVYPGLGLLLGTTHPIVAVVSGSMEHDGTFNYWWHEFPCCRDQLCTQSVSQKETYTDYGINEEAFGQFPFKNGFNKGDIMILWRTTNTKLGDVLVFNADHRLDPIIHRVVDVDIVDGKKVYKTKGDHNCYSADFEKYIREENAIGKAVLRIPLLGYIKLAFVGLLEMVK